MEEKSLEKLNRFVNSVDGEVEAQISDLLTTAKTEGETLLKHAEDQTLLQAFEQIQEQVKEIQAKYQRQLAQTEQDYHSALLTHREELVETIFGNVRTRLDAFTQSADYEAYLCGLLKGETVTADTTILVRPADLSHAQALQAACGNSCKVEADNGIEIGGLSLVVGDSNRINDKTLDTAFSEQRKQFSSQYSFHE